MFNVLITAASFISILYFKASLGKEIQLHSLLFNTQIVSLAGIILISIFAHSRIIEDKKFPLLTESLRLISVVVLTIYGFQSLQYFNWIISIVSIYCSVMFIWMIKLHLKPLKQILFVKNG